MSQNCSTNQDTVFDDTFQTMVRKRPSLLIPLINEAYGTRYSMDEKVTYQKLELARQEDDTLNHVRVEVCGKMYHIGFQPEHGDTIAPRMLESDVRFSMEHAFLQDDGSLTINFPNALILDVWNRGEETPRRQKGKVIFPHSQETEITIPVVRAQDYTVDQIFEKDLLILLPYYILRYQDILKTA